MAAPACTLNFDFENLIGESTGYAVLTLAGFLPQAPRTVGGVLAGITYSTAPAANTATVTVYSNAVLLPQNTYYLVTIFTADGRPVVQNVPYYLNDGTFNFQSLVPVGIPIPNVIVPTNAASANTFFAGPTSGIPQAATFRQIENSDLTGISVWDGVTIYADRIGGADSSAKIQTAIGLLPTAGGTVDARALVTETSGGGSATIDPGTKSVTILLGPVTYRIPQITLQTNLRIYGAGNGNQASSVNTTVIQTTDQTKDAFILGTNQAVQGVVLDGFRVRAVAGNSSQKGFNITAAVNGGLWYSSFRNLSFGSDFGEDHFRGGNMYFNGPHANFPGVNQFLDFTNVQSYRNSSTGHCLDIIGYAGQFLFDNCEFDGLAVNDGGTNISIADDNAQLPFSHVFQLCTIQKGTIGVSVRGSWNITFNACHFENFGGAGAGGVFNLAAASNNNIGFTISNCIFQTSGSATGAAYYVQDTSTNGEPVNFNNNFMTEPSANWPSQMNGSGNMQGIIPYAAANRIANTTQNSQIFTSSGTFTVPNGISSVKVRVIGGGAGGGGSTSTNNGGGGSAGGYAETWLTNLSPFSGGAPTQGNTITVAIGTGGAGGAGAATGTAGGNTTVVAVSPLSFTTITAFGGFGGFSIAAASPGGGTTGASTGPTGSLLQGGAPGGQGGNGIGGFGGSSVFGGGGNTAGTGGLPGVNATSRGSGGGGASSGSNQTGGSGLGGCVIFEWVN